MRSSICFQAIIRSINPSFPLLLSTNSPSSFSFLEAVPRQVKVRAVSMLLLSTYPGSYQGQRGNSYELSVQEDGDQ